MAVIVNEFGDMGIDGQLIRSVDDNVVEPRNGCLYWALSSERPALQNRGIKWDVKVISRPLYRLRWGIRASESDQIPTEWKRFYRSSVNLTIPIVVLFV